MYRFLPIFAVVATSLMGTAIVAALASGYDTQQPIVIAAAAGFILALPVTWFINKQLG